jgi:hypothetical protein
MIRKTGARALTLALACVLLGSPGAQAGTLARRQTLANLIQDAEIIVHGQVVAVSDGIDGTIPYTEVRVKVRETLRGTTGEVYTFRQFGLLAPRRVGNGLVNYTVSPAEWATYRPSEEVILFLYKAARKTGLRTTVGLGQGKFRVEAGKATSQQGNLALFQGVGIENDLLGDADRRLLATTRGPVSADALLSLVRRAVRGRWIETRRMRNAN